MIINETLLRDMVMQLKTHGNFTADKRWKNYQPVELVSKMFFVVSGRFQLSIENEIFWVTEGQLALLPPNRVVEYSVKSGETMQYHWLHQAAYMIYTW